MHETTHEFGRRRRLTGQQHAPRHRTTGFDHHARDRPTIHRQTQLRGRHTESTLRSGHAQITCCGQLCAGTEGRAIDSRDRDHGRRPEELQDT